MTVAPGRERGNGARARALWACVLNTACYMGVEGVATAMHLKIREFKTRQ